jgi:tetratricopeptide (TPR) repeat protein
LQADREYERGHHREALALYEKALTLGTAPVGAYARAALAAGHLGRNGRALAILKDAVAKLPPAEIKGPLWYNMGCFAARLGMLKDAVGYLGRAVDSGYMNLDKYRTDPDLLPLRCRRDFQTLLACLDS